MPRLSLLLDSSTSNGIIAIFEDAHLLYFKSVTLGVNSNTDFMVEIEYAFKELSQALKDLSYIAVGIGPGSYTGIRLSAVIAKSLSFACQIPLIPFCSLIGYVPKANGTFVAVLDARIGGFYVLKGIKTELGIEYTEDPKLLSLTEMSSLLQTEKIDHLLSPDYLLIHSKLSQSNDHAQDTNLTKNCLDSKIDPHHLLKISQKLYAEKKYILNGQLPLLYLRKTQAEIEKGK